MSTTRETVQHFLARLGARDIPGALDLVADPVNWEVSGSTVVPWVGRWSTKHELQEFMGLIADDLTRYRLSATAEEWTSGDAWVPEPAHYSSVADNRHERLPDCNMQALEQFVNQSPWSGHRHGGGSPRDSRSRVGGESTHCQPAPARLSAGSGEAVRLWSRRAVMPGAVGRLRGVPSRSGV